MNPGATKTGLAVIGLGMGAKPHLRSLTDLAPGIEVRGVFARDRQHREAAAAASGFPAASSIEELANDPNVDAALILTPPNARAELVQTFATAGKHILMEKPVERTVAKATGLVETCERAGVTLGIVFQQRFRAGSMRLKQLIAQGELGAIGAVHLNVPWWRPQKGYYDVPGRGTLERDGGGVLISQAIHPLDLMLSVTGPVEEVQAVAGTTNLHQMETEDFVGAGMRFQNGALGVLAATTASFPGHGESLRLDCQHGSALLASGTLTVNWHDGRSETLGETAAAGVGADPMDFPHEWHRDLIADFVDAIGTGRPPRIPGREALRVHRLIEALLESSASRQAVKVAGDT
jgi:UDP-N-acetyl-2-amino-2-deoxyglucuronate dehydrogenase